MAYVLYTEVYTLSVLFYIYCSTDLATTIKETKVFPSQNNKDVKELANIRDAAYWAKDNCILQPN